MSQSIDPRRLQELRNRADLTRKNLGERTGINPQTIYRIEAGRPEARSPRRETVEKLAATLGVSPEVLTGQAPLPDREPARAGRSNDEDYSINVTVDGRVRNAFTLTVMRYRVPIARIVELAPFLFVLAAEGSLERRRVELKKLREAFGDAQRLYADCPYLPTSLCPPDPHDGDLDAIEKSISARDIWGDRLPDHGFDETYDNPFADYLRKTAPADADVALIQGFDRSSSEFNVCREDALKLVDGADDKEELATSIVEGEVILHRMPRELFSADAVDARVSWLREKRDAYRAAVITSSIDLL